MGTFVGRPSSATLLAPILPELDWGLGGTLRGGPESFAGTGGGPGGGAYDEVEGEVELDGPAEEEEEGPVDESGSYC